MTKDQVTARVDAVVYFRVEDPVKAIILAENYFDSTFRISQSTLRDVLGTKSLSEILSDRETISDHMSVSLILNSQYIASSPGHSQFFNVFLHVTKKKKKRKITGDEARFYEVNL